MTILKIEPGTYSPIVARLRNGWPAAAAVRVKAATAVVGSAIAFALKVGVEAIARTRPVRGSSITTAPRSEPSALTAASWSLSDRLRVRLSPCVAPGASFESRSSSEFGLPWPLSSAL